MKAAVKAKGRHVRQTPPPHFDFDLETIESRVESAKTNFVCVPGSVKSADDFVQWLNAQ